MKPAARRKARKFALQGLYQLYMADHAVSDTEAHLQEEINPEKVDLDYFQQLLRGCAKETAYLDDLYQEFLDRPFADLTPIECCILRLACFEMDKHHEVPYKVVINEALELGKRFGAVDAHKFLNGVLDKLANKLRPLETQS